MDERLEKLYKTTLAKSDEYGESCDCAVRAVAIATGEGYDMAHYFMTENGRKKRRGTYFYTTLEVLKDLGYSCVKIDKPEDIKTAITLERHGGDLMGSFLVRFPEHLAAFVDGRLLDYYKGRRCRVRSLYKVEKA